MNKTNRPMPKKRKPEPLLKDIQVVQFEPGEFRPLFVAAKNIENVVIGYSKKTASNDRSAKRGPPFFMVLIFLWSSFFIC